MRYTKMLAFVTNTLNKLRDQPVEVCLNSVMATAIELWATLYEGRAPWLSKKQGIKSAGLPAAISAEMARLVTLELQSKARVKEIDEIYQTVLQGLRCQVEYACALGGMVFKPYPLEDGIGVQFIRADRFFPLSFDSSGNVSQCVFIEQFKAGKTIYTRMEIHTLENDGLTVRNLAFSSQTDQGLGSEIELSSVEQWLAIEPEATFDGVKKLPIGYFKIPLANTIDPDSPLGVSVFSRAIGLIAEADRRYSNLCWEFEAKETAVHVAESMLKYDKTNDKFEYPGGKERLYRTLQYSAGATDKPLIDVYSPDIRAEALKSGYQDQLRMIEFACGLAYGTLSDPSEVAKTATEIRSSKQRSYATVTAIQMALERALRDLVDAIAFWAAQLGITSEVPTVTFSWDDSIVVDSDALAKQALLELQSGVIDNVEYYKRVYGLDEKAALKLAEDIAARAPAPSSVDFFAGSDAGDDISPLPDASKVQAVAQQATGERLNGAQVKSLMEVIAQYTSGALSESAAINLIVSAFGMTEVEARKLLGLGEVV